MEDTLDADVTIQPENVKYATFWQRFAGYILDTIVIVFISSSLKWAIADSIRWQYDNEMGYEETQNMAYLIWTVYMIVIRWCYFAGMESSPLKATVGKIAVGLYVTDELGDRITFGKATGRFFGKILSGLLLMIGYIMAAFTVKKQALHDQLCGCLVISK